ncbi:MAG: Hsp20/alpha crystallin family protein [Betaproteobacteria bacterium]|nr:Hsp20/alpha crystallin family protein [Betaproteobacteria bacterium]
MNAEQPLNVPSIKEKTMFFAPIAPVNYRNNAHMGVERFLKELARAHQSPTTEFEQDEQQYKLRMDVPGVTREQISVWIEEQVVKINTLADAPRAYQALFELPLPIDAAASSAKLEHGVLSLILVKKLPENKAHAVMVQ